MQISFLYPSVLYFLFALLIPVVIHLFSFRKFQTVFFSNNRFLRNIIIENNKTKSKLKQLLILISRLLALAVLIIAFANPYIPSKNKNEKTSKNTAIYLDNSFSTTTKNSNGKLIDQAKKKAALICKSHPADNKYFLYSNSFSSIDEFSLSQEQCIKSISKLKPGPNRRTLNESINRGKSILSEEEGYSTLYIITDLQKNIVDLNEDYADSNISIVFVPLQTPSANNLFIDSCWFSTPHRTIGKTETLYISIKNTGNENYTDIPVKLFLNDTLKSISSVSIEANTTKETSIHFSNSSKGYILGRVEISDFPVIYDNQYYFSYKIPDKIEILSVNKNVFIESVFKNDSAFTITYSDQRNLNYASLDKYDILFLNSISEMPTGLQNACMQFMNNGGSIVFSPDNTINSNVNDFLQSAKLSFSDEKIIRSAEISQINTNHIIIKDTYTQNNTENIQYPSLFSYFPSNIQSDSKVIPILSTKEAEMFLCHTKMSNGNLYIFSSSINDSVTSFTNHPLFIPTIYNMALFSIEQNRIQWNLSNENIITLDGGLNSELLKISSTNSDLTFIPSVQKDIIRDRLNITLTNEIENAGHYFVYNQDNIIKSISLNYSRTESDLTFLTLEQFEDISLSKGYNNIEILSEDNSFISNTIQQIDFGIQLWKYFILLCIIFILIEVLLIRLL